VGLRLHPADARTFDEQLHGVGSPVGDGDPHPIVTLVERRGFGIELHALAGILVLPRLGVAEDEEVDDRWHAPHRTRVPQDRSGTSSEPVRFVRPQPVAASMTRGCGMDRVTFYFDPRCPWCYQTSRWARRLSELDVIDLDWGVFSLEVVNLEEGKDPLEIDSTGGPSLRSAITLIEEEGSKAVGPFYAALGRRQFEEVPPFTDTAAAVKDSLAEAGLDPSLCDRAMADPKTWSAVVASTQDIVDRVGKLGVPTIVLDGDGPAIFGPVISDMPNDQDAIELWQHTAWLVRYGNFGELKRKREPQTDLPMVTWRREQRERQANA
jgi:protein-disulfide isomerase-like protein with CxxC motif